ncbi:MAG: GNAT family N-acetyltransferase [Candidatus Latescibacteria bacterium]|nr:GNAT family N-acetyltransferase [Candidatus Latescibacterota bacterium]
MTLFEPFTPEHWRDARRLIETYAASLNVDLSFQNFGEEIEHLSIEYGPPNGAFLLAEASDRAIGCVGLRAFDETTGEIKRLYVDPAARGHGAGRALAEAIVARGREIGYARLVLDTLPTMGAAQALYVALGFTPIEPYRFNPVPGTAFMELNLR